MDRLLADYDNLYADLSPGSGHNAMTRDPEFTSGFIGRHWRKLLWESDIVGMHESHPQVEWMRAVPVSEEVRQAIADGNARKLLGLV